MDTPTWLDETELRAWKGVALVGLQMNAELGRRLAWRGYSFADYLVLASLSDDPDGKRRVIELSTELGWEKSRLSHHVAKMATRGLVTKERCRDDQRGTFVVLAPAGRELVAAAAPAHVRDVRELFLEALSPAQIRALADAAAAILAHLDATLP